MITFDRFNPAISHVKKNIFSLTLQSNLSRGSNKRGKLTQNKKSIPRGIKKKNHRKIIEQDIDAKHDCSSNQRKVQDRLDQARTHVKKHLTTKTSKQPSCESQGFSLKLQVSKRFQK